MCPTLLNADFVHSLYQAGISCSNVINICYLQQTKHYQKRFCALLCGLQTPFAGYVFNEILRYSHSSIFIKKGDYTLKHKLSEGNETHNINQVLLLHIFARLFDCIIEVNQLRRKEKR